MKIEDIVKTVKALNSSETNTEAGKKLGVSRQEVERRIREWPIDREPIDKKVTKSYKQTWIKRSWKYKLRGK